MTLWKRELPLPRIRLVLRRERGQIEWISGLFFLLFLGILLCFFLQISVYRASALYLEDALAATRAAVEEGIICGGGSAYIHASKEVAKLADTLEGDEKTGASIVLKALEAPLYHIAANAGLEGSVIINKVRESEVGVGFDALKEEYVDMVKAGILDPAKVTRSALQNATSVASTLLTTESVVANIKEETPAMPAGGAGGMGGMM